MRRAFCIVSNIKPHPRPASVQYSSNTSLAVLFSFITFIESLKKNREAFCSTLCTFVCVSLAEKARLSYDFYVVYGVRILNTYTGYVTESQVECVLHEVLTGLGVLSYFLYAYSRVQLPGHSISLFCVVRTYVRR